MDCKGQLPSGSCSGISPGLNWGEVKRQPDEILDLPQQMAKLKGWKIIVCIGEFQNIGFYRIARPKPHLIMDS